MNIRHSFLICRVAAFAALLITAGATSVSVAAGAGDDRLMPFAGNTQAADIAQTGAPATGGNMVRRSARL